LILQRQDLHKRLDLNSNTCKSVLGDDDVEGDPEELVLQRQDLHKRLETTEAELVKSKFKLARSSFIFLTTVVHILKSKMGGLQISSANRKFANLRNKNLCLDLQALCKCDNLRLGNLRTSYFLQFADL
jgi:hypothetical protein